MPPHSVHSEVREMEMSEYGTILSECSFLEDTFESTRPSVKRDLTLRKENIQSLKAIQNVISFYEDEILSLDEVLARVLEFYRKFVPYK